MDAISSSGNGVGAIDGAIDETDSSSSSVLIFEDILRSVGAFSFDSSAAEALEEATARFTIDLLCDAKDYSNYCGKAVIDDADARVAIETSDSNMHKLEDRKIFLRSVAKEINCKSLLDLLDVTTVKNKYSHTPSDIEKHHRANGKLLSRTCTLEYGRDIIDSDTSGGVHEKVDQRAYFGSIEQSDETGLQDGNSSSSNSNSNINNNSSSSSSSSGSMGSYINTNNRKPFSLRNINVKSRNNPSNNIFGESS